MKTFDIKGVARTSVGKHATKELRSNGQVPCVLYGGETNIHFSVNERDFQHLVYTPHVYVVNVDVDGKTTQAIMQDIQFHSVSDAIEHVDFLQISESKPISMLVPVKLSGLAEGVKQGGKLMLKLRKLRVRGLAKDIPDTVDIDVSNLMLGKSIKISELNFEKFELLDPKNAVVTTVRLTRSAMSAKLAAADTGKK